MDMGQNDSRSGPEEANVGVLGRAIRGPTSPKGFEALPTFVEAVARVMEQM